MRQRPFIDFGSDTKTRPTPAMRQAMANADCGDEAVLGAAFGALFVRGVSYGLVELMAIPAAFVCAGAASAAGSLVMARRATSTALPTEPTTLSLDEST